MKEVIKNYWDDSSDERYESVREEFDLVFQNPARAFPAAVYPLLEKYLGNFAGKKVLVPSSGDNLAVLGFCLMGATVASCDLSENQIRNAGKMLERYGCRAELFCDNTMTLEKVPEDIYDLVYTSNGVHVWIDDLAAMYGSVYRVLKKGGYSIFFDTHPMGRPFDNKICEVKIRKPYEDVGPFDDVPTYEWRTQDLVNAIASSRLTIREMQEFHSVPEDIPSHNYLIVRKKYANDYHWAGNPFDWRDNPWAALPQCLCICSQK